MSTHSAYNLNKSSFAETLAEYSAAIDWVSSQVGSCGSRHRKYLVILGELVNAKDANDYSRILREHGELYVYNSLYESAELVSIHQSFKGYSGGGLTGKLKALSKGPDSYRDEQEERADNFGRDIAFELFAASRLITDLVSVDLRESDFALISGSKKCFVECKRPSSMKRIEKCIQKANQQLPQSIRKESLTSHEFGLIAISLNKVINPGFMFLEARNFESMKARIKRDVHAFFEQHISPIANKTQYCSRAFFLNLTGIAILQEENLPMQINQSLIRYPIVSDTYDNPTSAFFKNLCRGLALRGEIDN